MLSRLNSWALYPNVAHKSGTTAGFLMGAAGLGSFFIGLIAFALSDRLGRRAILVTVGLSSALLPHALMVPGMHGRLWLRATILFLTRGGQAISAICSVLVPAESVPRRMVGSAIEFTTPFGEMFGGFLAPIVAGTLATTHELDVPLWLGRWKGARLSRRTRPKTRRGGGRNADDRDAARRWITVVLSV